MELTHLRTFAAVAEAGSLTRAAESLHLSQPAVSGHIKALEIQWGLPLFRRKARGMELTPAGRELLKAAEAVLQEADQVNRLVDKLRGDAAGGLRLGTIDCGSDLKLARIIGQTTQRLPDLEVQIAASNSGLNVRSILDGDSDLAFVEGTFDEPRLRQWRIATSRVGVIGPIAWRDDLVDAGWARLAEFPWIFQSPTCSYCVLLEKLNEQHELKLRPQIRASAFGDIKHLVAEGLALSIADLDDADDLVEAGQLFIWPHFTYEMPLWLIALDKRTDEPAIKAFAENALAVHDSGRRRQARRVEA